MTWWLGILITSQVINGATSMVKYRQALHVDTPVRMAVYKGGISVTVDWGFSRWHRSRPKLTTGTVLVLAGTELGVAIHDSRVRCF
jgi:hypothetical protein